VDVLGDSNISEKYSITGHLINRWNERISTANAGEIRVRINNIISKGNKYPIDNDHYRICYEGMCIVFMKLSPLHSLAKTVYLKDEEELGAI
jgi:hypothetical protein